jgi:dephospho-CoA kinase
VDVVVLCGPMGAGKSTAARILAEQTRAQSLSFTSAVFTPVLQALQIDPSRAAFQGLGQALMSWPGEEQLVRALLARWDKSQLLVLDDVRYRHTLDLVIQEAESVFVLYINCPDGTRFTRLQVRDQLSSRDEFRRISARATEREIASLRGYADAVILNDGSLDEFRADIGHIIAGW